MDICSSPWLLAACHVLLRLLMPRHSPCALSCLTYVYTFPVYQLPFFSFPCFLFRSALFSFQCARVNTSVFTECLPFGILPRKTRFRDYPSHNPYAGDFASQNSLSGFPSKTLSREILLRKTPRKLGKFLLAFVVIAFIHRYTDSSPCNFHLVSLTDIQNYTA